MTKSEGSFTSWRRRLYGFNTELRREWLAGEAASIPAGSRVLDAGAGIGQYRSLFEHCDYRAQDFGQEPATVGKYTKLDYECDITSIPVEDGSFDAVLCIEVLEHVPDPVAAVNELARILRPGGRLIMTAPLGSFLHQEPYHYYGGYTPYWYMKFLTEAGLRVDSVERNLGFFSLFGQESIRYRELLRAGLRTQTGAMRWLGMGTAWLLMAPLSRLLPLVGRWLDSLSLEQMATVGYHVIAVKHGGQ